MSISDFERYLGDNPRRTIHHQVTPILVEAWKQLLYSLRSAHPDTPFDQGGIDFQNEPLDWAFRPNIPRVWTVDFDQGRLFLDRPFHHKTMTFEIPLLQPVNIYWLPKYTPDLLPLPSYGPSLIDFSWKPPDIIPLQLFNLVYRLVFDYYHNWMNNSWRSTEISQQLAFGILSCFTLNFDAKADVTENVYKLFPLQRNLRTWRTWASPPVIHTINLQGCVIIYTTNIQDAYRLVHDHYLEVYSIRHPLQSVTYVVTSLLHVQIFKRLSSGFKATFVCPFLSGTFNSKDSISIQARSYQGKTAIRWILNAIHAAHYPLATRLHELPTELQERVLDFASDCEVGRALYGGILGIGVPFSWTKKGVPLKLLTSASSEHPKPINSSEPEQMVVFWDKYIAMSYQPDDRESECKWGWSNCCLPPLESN